MYNVCSSTYKITILCENGPLTLSQTNPDFYVSTVFASGQKDRIERICYRNPLKRDTLLLRLNNMMVGWLYWGLTPL